MMAGIFVLIRFRDMQITEQIIQRIARQVFNQMFPSSLRQSGAIISGSGGSVQYAAEAGHAATADSASSASSASSVPWSGVTGKPSFIEKLAWWTYEDSHNVDSLMTGTTFAYTSHNAPVNGTIVAFSYNGNGYPLQLQGSYSDEYLYFRNYNGDNGTWNTWRYVIHSGNIGSQSVSYATTAGTANAVAWDNVNDKPATATRWPSWSEVTNKPTSKTAWGQTYLDGDSAFQSISGNMTNVGDISFSASGKKIGGFLYFDTGNSRLGIGESAPTEKLHINGGLLKIVNNGRTLTIGAQNASAIHIYNDNNSTTFVNGGFSSSGDTSYDLGSASYRWATVYANRLIAYSTTDAEAGAANAVALITGAPQGYHLEMDGNEIMAKSDGTHSSPLYLNAEGGNVVINETSGNCGIGTSNPQYKLHVDGTIYATGSITERSDIRLKDVETYAWAPALSSIADAPIAIYTMKDDKEHRRRVGSIAQYWQKAMPEAVCEAADGTLSMNYGEISLVSVIALAREVRNLKAQIEMLKRR